MVSCSVFNRKAEALARKSANLGKGRGKDFYGMPNLNSKQKRKLKTINRQYQALKRKARVRGCSI